MEYTIKYDDPPACVRDKTIRTPECFDDNDLMKELFPEHLYEERVYAIFLTQSLTIRNITLCGVGNQVSAVVNITKIARDAIIFACPRVILIHNHPSGNVLFSKADKALARKINEALQLFECKLDDSLIWTGSRIISAKYTGDFV